MTTQISVTDYFTGPGMVRRDEKYAAELTEEIQKNAEETVLRVNQLLAAMAAAKVPLVADPTTGSLSHSGWRPPEVNAVTPGAAKASRHMTGQADDLHDPRGYLDAWCMANQKKLAEIGLWLESPTATLGWCHVQTVPPKSGRRVFIP